MEVFDLTHSLNQIKPAFWYDALFAVVGLGMLVVAVIILRSVKRGQGDTSDRIRRIGWFLLPFSLFWITFTSWMNYQDIRHAYAVRREVAQGRYFVREGCLEYFRAGVASPGKSTAGNERWKVEGREFSYGAGEVRFGYHAVEPRGGIVHPHSRVRVFFVEDEFLGRDDIVRLEAQARACPSAPDAP